MGPKKGRHSGISAKTIPSHFATLLFQGLVPSKKRVGKRARYQDRDAMVTLRPEQSCQYGTRQVTSVVQRKKKRSKKEIKLKGTKTVKERHVQPLLWAGVSHTTSLRCFRLATWLFHSQSSCKILIKYYKLV